PSRAGFVDEPEVAVAGGQKRARDISDRVAGEPLLQQVDSLFILPQLKVRQGPEVQKHIRKIWVQDRPAFETLERLLRSARIVQRLAKADMRFGEARIEDYRSFGPADGAVVPSRVQADQAQRPVRPGIAVIQGHRSLRSLLRLLDRSRRRGTP